MYDDMTDMVFIYMTDCHVQNLAHGTDFDIEEAAIHISEDEFVRMVDDLIKTQRQILDERIDNQANKIEELQDEIHCLRNPD